MDILKRIHDYSQPPWIVAELSANHGGDLSKAIRLVQKAIKAGADAIKLQTYKPDTITVEGKVIGLLFRMAYGKEDFCMIYIRMQ